jgi:hypothetical protein
VTTESSTPFTTFDLDVSSGAVGLKPENNLFQRELNQVMDEIDKHLSKLSDYKPSRTDGAGRNHTPKNYSHDSILLAGARGAGKTTFLLSVINAINEHKTTQNVVVPLGDPLDPTLIDSDEVFLAAIIGVIHRQVTSRTGTQPRRDYDKALATLAKGLAVLSTTAAHETVRAISSSPDLFGERLLTDAMTGVDLRESFVRYVEAALHVCGAKMFVLLLDDVDMHFANGWTVLETVRRYLVDPRLLPIISGDLELYGLVVREHMWQRLYKLAEREDSEAVKKQVHTLEAQYLLKLLRPGSRVFLPDPLARLKEHIEHSNDKKIMVKQSGGKDADLLGLIKSVNKHYFGVDVADPMHASSPGARLFTQNTRQIRAALTWLHRWAPGEADEKDPVVLRNKVQGGIRALRDLHPQIRDSGLTANILDNIEHKGEYGDLTIWACSRDKLPEIWRLDVSQLDDDPETEPYVAAVLVVLATIYQRWTVYPEEMFDFIGRFALPALVERESSSAKEALDASGNMPVHPATQPEWRLSEPGSAAETASRVALHYRRGTTGKSPFSVKLRRKSDPEYRQRSALVFATDPEKQNPKRSDGISGWLALLQKLPQQDPLPTAFPSYPTWRRLLLSANNFVPAADQTSRESAMDILAWYQVETRLSSSTSSLVEPLGGMVMLGKVLRIARDTHAASRKGDPTWQATIDSPVTFGQSIQKLARKRTIIDESGTNTEDGETESEEAAFGGNFSSQFPRHLWGWSTVWHQKLSPIEPRTIIDCISFFQENAFRTKEEAPFWRWTVGSALGLWTAAFTNAFLRDALRRTGGENAAKHQFTHGVSPKTAFHDNILSIKKQLGTTNITAHPVVTFWKCLMDAPTVSTVLSGCDLTPIEFNTEGVALPENTFIKDALAMCADSTLRPEKSPRLHTSTISWLLQGLIPVEVQSSVKSMPNEPVDQRFFARISDLLDAQTFITSKPDPGESNSEQAKLPETENDRELITLMAREPTILEFLKKKGKNRFGASLTVKKVASEQMPDTVDEPVWNAFKGFAQNSELAVRQLLNAVKQSN